MWFAEQIKLIGIVVLLSGCSANISGDGSGNAQKDPADSATQTETADPGDNDMSGTLSVSKDKPANKTVTDGSLKGLSVSVPADAFSDQETKVTFALLGGDPVPRLELTASGKLQKNIELVLPEVMSAPLLGKGLSIEVVIVNEQGQTITLSETAVKIIDGKIIIEIGITGVITVKNKASDKEPKKTPSTNETAPGSFSINAPESLYNTDPGVSWSAAAGADSYEVVVAEVSGCSPAIKTVSAIAGTSVVLSGLPDGLYFICVQAKNKTGSTPATNNGVSGFTLDKTAPGAFNVSGPSGTIFNANPQVTWSAASGANSYELKIDDDAGCNTPIITESGLSGTMFNVPMSLAPATTYYTCLTASDAAGNLTTATNSGLSFTVTVASFSTKLGIVEKINSRTKGYFSAGPGVWGTWGHFGTSVALSEDGQTMAVGVISDSYAPDNSFLYYAGSINVFTKVAGSWVFQQKLTPSGSNSRMEEDVFGVTVSISGDTIVAGTVYHQYDADGANPLSNAGAVWVFTRSNNVWTQQQKITPAGTNARNINDNFGTSVAISGETLVVGSSQHGYDATGGDFITGAGAAWVYTRSAGSWTLQQKIVGTGTNGRLASDSFGNSVAISADTIAVGASFQDYDGSGANFISAAGAVYLFTRSGSVWSPQQKIVGEGSNGRNTNDNFGYSVSLHSDTIAVGAWKQAFDADGLNSVSNAGAAFVYTRSLGVWSLQQKLVATGTNARNSSDYFASRLVVNSDTLLVNSHQHQYDAAGADPISSAGAAWVFKRNGSTWTTEQKLVGSGTNGRNNSDYFARHISLAGDSIVLGAPNHDYNAAGAGHVMDAGAVFTFNRNAGVWSPGQKVTEPEKQILPEDPVFGHSVAISQDKSTLVVGAAYDDHDASGTNSMYAAGAVYVYTGSPGNWTIQQKLVASGTNNRMQSDYFGKSVAISGNTIIVGADGQDYDAGGANYIQQAGAAYIFVRSGAVWTQQAKLAGEGVNGRGTIDYFGREVAIDGDTVVIGSSYHDYDQDGANLLSNAGAAFVFKRTGTTWALEQKLVSNGASGRAGSEYYGNDVGISGDTIVVGGYLGKLDAAGANSLNGAGGAYVYKRSAGVWNLEQKLVASGTNGRNASDYFGISTAISGDTIAIGAYGHQYDEASANPVSNGGAAFIFTRAGSVWTLQQKVAASGTNARNASDYFGYAVDVDGDYLVVGAYGHDYDETGAILISEAGAAWRYTRSLGVWTQDHKYTGTGLKGRVKKDLTGFSVAVRAGFSLIGSPWHDYAVSGSDGSVGLGAVFTFNDPL